MDPDKLSPYIKAICVVRHRGGTEYELCPMEVDAFMTLMRMTTADDKVVANLAHMALNLAKGIRDAEARAELAEASLQAERARIAGFINAVRQSGNASLPAL